MKNQSKVRYRTFQLREKPRKSRAEVVGLLEARAEGHPLGGGGLQEGRLVHGVHRRMQQVVEQAHNAEDDLKEGDREKLDGNIKI